MPADRFDVWLEGEEVLADLVHPQGLGERWVLAPVVHRLHLSRTSIGDVHFGFDGPEASQHVILVLLAVIGGEPVVDEGNGHRSQRPGEVELSDPLLTFWRVLNSKILLFLVLLTEYP